MGEGAAWHPSPLLLRCDSELPSPTRGEGAITTTAPVARSFGYRSFEFGHFHDQVGEALGGVERALAASCASHGEEPLRVACKRADFNRETLGRERLLAQTDCRAGSFKRAGVGELVLI